ncbi:MAG TPA: arginine deiminase family protein [Candidatus Dormibacteraeota bacterium]|nr:arginine deiminase family protein [Candidatus Dormibacteraeota bacterium]
MESKVRAEWDTLQDVVIHRPGIEMFFGLIEPFAFLYERSFNMDLAIHEHNELRHALQATGARVHQLRSMAIRQAREDSEIVRRLRKHAKKIVAFEGTPSEVKRAREEFEADITDLGVRTLFNILVLRPSIKLERKRGVRVLYPRVSLDVPLANLFFMRDQQVASDTGLIVSRMSKPQRRMEPTLTRTVLETAGARVVHQVASPGTFEGGDFIPAGKFAMIGVGDRTNLNGARQVLQNGVGFQEIALVHQPAHPLLPNDEPDPMIDMHLDTYLNFPGNHVAVGCVPLLKEARVELYQKSARGYKRMSANNANLYDYLIDKGFTIVPITTLEQMCYASNFLCIKDHSILAIEVERVVKKVLKNLEAKARSNPYRYNALLQEARQDLVWLKQSDQFFPHKREFQELSIEVTSLQLEEITGGYGGIRCMTCVMNRKPAN